MQQLSGTDTGFLYAEQGNTYNHVAMLAIYDPSTAVDGNADGSPADRSPTDGSPVRFKDILAHFKERLHVNPLFRRRLVEVPLGVDRPYWVEDPDCDVEFHVRHIALPAPGDWRQLMIQVARLHARPLDRSRPLWEIYVIEGLDRIPGLPAGCFAMFYKMHHASVDGMAGLHLISQIHAWSPEPLNSSSEFRVVMADRDPCAAELAARAVFNNTSRAVSCCKRSMRSITPYCRDHDRYNRREKSNDPQRDHSVRRQVIAGSCQGSREYHQWHSPWDILIPCF